MTFPNGPLRTTILSLVTATLLFACAPAEESGPDDAAIIDDEPAEQETIPDVEQGLPEIDHLPDTDTKVCQSGDTETCPYGGPAGTEGIGPCKAGERTCLPDGTGFGECTGEVLPLFELCGNGIDDDCDGEADTPDMDGDGVTACAGDCCETTGQCPDPAAVLPGAEEVRNGIDDNCNDIIDEFLPPCDDTLDPTSAVDHARAMGICTVVGEAGAQYGLVSAELLFPNGHDRDDSVDWQGNPFPKKLPAEAHALLAKLGDTILPREGTVMVAFSSGKAADPYEPLVQNTESGVPGDWYSANGDTFPSSPACGGGSSAGEPVFDAVMFELTLKVPPQARSFSMNIYFFSQEFPGYVCNEYNDFFIVLLDSAYDNPDPLYQNPADKNLAKDKNDNPVGVNLARSGLFHVCDHPDYDSCAGDADLTGTGFEGRGGTGWLVTRGNVVPGETITIRIALWDTYDHNQDSLTLIDNFRWYTKEFRAGTGDES